MKKLLPVLILLVLGGGGAYYYYTYGKAVEKPQVVTATVSQGDIIEAVKATGALEALRTVQVGSQVSGVVQALYADFNWIVKKDQVVAKIDPTLLEVQVQIAKANIGQREGDIAMQKVQLEDAVRKFNRAKELAASGLTTQEALEAAELAVKTRQASIENAERSLVQARAALQQAELNVTYTSITSPVDGVVVERRVDVGQTVQSSMNVAQFFVIATDLRNLKLTAGVDEADIGRVQRGQRVEFTVEAYGQAKFIGEVEAVRLNATNQNNVVTYPVWITVPNPELKLKPSMTANISIIISTAPNVIRVPNQALRFRPNADIYRALGLEPPAPGAGRRLTDETQNNGAAAPGQRPGGTGPGGTVPQAGPESGGGSRAGSTDAQPATRDGGRGEQVRADSQAGEDRPRGQGFGGQGGMGTLTPEQRERFRQQFSAGRGGGGRGGGNQGGGGRGGGRGSQTPVNAPTVQPKPLEGEKIDDLFTPIPRKEEPGNVWTWDEAKKELREHRLRLGITDGQFSELLSGNLTVGQAIVTGVIIPNLQPRPGQQFQQGNPLMGPQRGPGFGQPGGGRGGDGGGGRGGGGGGGGRGGN
jgi:HlyD family secretion protein